MTLKVPAYYNERDAFAASWLRNLIAAGHIAPGIVDERSIEDVTPGDLLGFTQCHFFAGIGVWSHALRGAGFPDGRPVWTGSCPCQPFSAAGKGGGFTDERHLWPAWHYLIEQCRPPLVFGEQVASRDGLAWLDLVHSDMEGAGYAFGAFDLCAAGVGAPHIRQRLYFVADTASAQREGRATTGHDEQPRPGRLLSAGSSADADALAYVSEPRRGAQPQRATGTDRRPSPESGRLRDSFWHNADWLPCTDGKARPVEPIAQQMVDGAAQSLGRLRAGAVEEIQKEIADAFRCEADAREALRHVLAALSAEAPNVWRTRRLSDVYEMPVLLAFVRQLADQGWPLAQSILRAGAEVTETSLRSVRLGVSTARASQERGLDGQRPDEHTDALRVLSSILARHAQAAWGEAFRRHAADAFPLIVGAPGRVGRLRAYGNAIVAPLAREFIAAYMECAP